MKKKNYIWFYDHIHSRYYNLLMKWSFLPFGGEAKCRDKLISHIKFCPDEKILDMCCGTGGATCSIAKRAGKESSIIGIDLSFGQLRVAAKRGRENVDLIKGDAAATGFPDEYFHKVFITHALHEMTRSNRKQVLIEAKRVLKENGSLIVLELDRPDNLLIRLFTGFWFFYWLPFNFETPTRRDMLKNGLTNELLTAGFSNIIGTRKFQGIFQTVTASR